MNMRKGFTLVEIMIVVAILGLLIAIGVPGFLTARNKSRLNSEKANLKAIEDNISSYGINQIKTLDIIERLWPTSSTISDPESYIRRQLLCPITKTSYTVVNANSVGSCTNHGTTVDVNNTYG